MSHDDQAPCAQSIIPAVIELDDGPGIPSIKVEGGAVDTGIVPTVPKIKARGLTEGDRDVVAQPKNNLFIVVPASVEPMTRGTVMLICRTGTCIFRVGPRPDGQ